MEKNIGLQWCKHLSLLFLLLETMSLTIANYCLKCCKAYTWVLYILIVIFIITAVSNGANITDGLDGL